MEVKFVRSRLFDAGFGLTVCPRRENTLLLTNTTTGETLTGRYYTRTVLDRWAEALRIVEELGSKGGFTSGGKPVLIQAVSVIGP